MPAPKAKGLFKVCSKSGRVVGYNFGSWWACALFPLLGLLAFVWVMVRVSMKPSRAAYPCMKVAMPLAGGFVGYVASFVAAVVAVRQAKAFLRRSRFALAGACLAAGLAAAVWCLHDAALDAPAAATGTFTPSDAANAPVGTAQGIHPGRVTWVHDPAATSWDGSSSFWWSDGFNSQTAVNAMLSQAVLNVSGQATVAAAWDALFKHRNQLRGKGSVGYASTEKIAVKINLNCGGNNQNIDASPHMVFALLDQLVNQAGVPQAAITLYDAQRGGIDAVRNRCSPTFPGVKYNSWGSWVNEQISYSAFITDYNARRLPQAVVEAEYMINFASLKRHCQPTDNYSEGYGQTGITVCGKNHFGTIGNTPALHERCRDWYWGMPCYNDMVDLIGSRHLGGKTVLYLVDGLYAGDRHDAVPKRWQMAPFNGDWPSSLLASQDPVAVDSVALDFLRSEWPLVANADNYLHEAAWRDGSNRAPSGTQYRPDGTVLGSLGVHEHWNNATDKKYSRNLGTGNGIELVPLSSSVQPPPAGPGTGITREWWTGIAGTAVADLTGNAAFPNSPAGRETLTALFEAPTDWADNYGTRVRGTVIAPVTGDYVFWIAADDNAELWLSTDTNPANTAKIASVTGWTGSREWTKLAGQQSAAIRLTAGQRYYIEALQKEGGGGDNLAVGWQFPNGALERPIPYHRLAPWSDTYALTVNSGSGDGSYAAGTAVTITADAPPSGQVFDRWRIDAGSPTLANATSATTTLTMPASDATVTATYLTPPPPAGPGTGITREWWTGIAGTAVADLTGNAAFPNSPTGSATLTSLFEAPTDWADNYGTRIRGTVIAPVTGDYVFWIAADDNAELWLSTDTSPANKAKIASVSGWTGSREWTKLAGQQSAAIRLTAGQRYYVEALQKEGTGGDNLAVGWQFPNGALERPIPYHRLAPWADTYALTVNSGNGDGSYAAGAVVTITADSPPSGQLFDRWRIDAGSPTLANATSATTTLTMPASAATVTATYVTPPPPDTGTGLWAEVFDNADFTARKLSRTDASVNFDWGAGSPDASVGADTFSVRWSGAVQPRYTETYTFTTTTDDGVRLWVDGQLLVDKWVDQGPTDWSGTIALTAGRKYDIRMDYYENGGGAVAKLSWSSASQAREIIPQGRLFPWSSRDIGGVGVAGSDTVSGSNVTVQGSGDDIWNNADAFRYVYKVLTGDGEVQVKVTSVQNTNAWAKAGVMIRETLAADSRHAFMALTPGNGLAFQRRTSAGGSSSHTSGGAASPPRWVRLVRQGESLSGYASADGASWTWIGTETIAMGSVVYAGLAVTSHDNAVLCTAQLDGAAVTAGPDATVPALVTIASVSTAKPYSLATAQVGALPYIDRSYTVTSLSAALNGGVLVRTSNDDKYITAASHLVLALGQAAKVYVCYDKRGTLPSWLSDGTWSATAESITSTDGAASPMRVYLKTVPAGSLTLGGNLAGGASGALADYYVVVQPAVSTKPVEADLASALFAPAVFVPGPIPPDRWLHEADRDGDGMPEMLDGDGDGLWNTFEPGYGVDIVLPDSDADGGPDETVTVPDGRTLWDVQEGFPAGGGTGGGGSSGGGGGGGGSHCGSIGLDLMAPLALLWALRRRRNSR